MADYRDSGFLAADRYSDAGSKDGSQTNLASSGKSPHRPSSLLHTLTHPPPFLPPKKGILKSRNYDLTRTVSNDLDNDGIVLKNTVDNEYVNVYRRSAISPPTASVSSNDSNEAVDREIPFVLAHATTKVRAHDDHVSPVNATPEKVAKLPKASSSKISVPSSEASTPSSMSTMDDAVWRLMLSGENLGVNHRPLSTNFHLQLPDLIPTLKADESSDARRDVLKRRVTVTRPSDDDPLFGLLIRRSTKLGSPVLLVDSGSAEDRLFVPGDRLIAVGDVDVEDKDRDEVVEILKGCTETQISVTVRPNLFSKLLILLLLILIDLSTAGTALLFSPFDCK